MKALATTLSVVKCADNRTFCSSVPKSYPVLVKSGGKFTADASEACTGEASAEWCEQHIVTLNIAQILNIVISLMTNYISTLIQWV